MKPLYEITNEYKNLIDELSHCEEINEEQLARLDAINNDLEKKLINISSFIKNLEAESDAVKNAIDAMSTRRSRLERKIERLQDYLMIHMNMLGIDKIKTPYFNVNLKKNPQSVVITDMTQLPERYLSVKEMIYVDKSSLKKDLRENSYIPGALLHQSQRLEIK